MLAFKLLLRNWRSGELKLLSLSLILAVAVISGISIFTDRLDTSMAMQSNAILGADRVIKSTQLINPAWETQAEQAHLRHTKSATFESMIYAGDAMFLASVKAVDFAYPLRGQLEVSQVAFTNKNSDISIANGIPKMGEAWIDSRLLSMLNIALGDAVNVGELSLKVTKVLIREPEQFSLDPRLLINYADLAASKLILPGSRVDYRLLLASDNASALTTYLEKIKPQLSANQSIVDPATAQENLGRVSKAGKQFLLLSTIIAVLLSGVAIAIAARQFSERHTNQVALMKSMGVGANRIRQLYFSQLLILGVIASLLGLCFGQVIQFFVAQSLQEIYRFNLSDASIAPYLLSFLSGILCLTFFALPALWFLPSIPPVKILRRELAVNLPQRGLQAGLAFTAIILLIFLFSSDLTLTMIVSGGLIAVMTFSVLIALALLRVSGLLASRMSGSWRLAFSILHRQKLQTLMQIIVFSVAIMSLLTLTIIRSSLIDEWSTKIPEKAPNVFLVNISPNEVDAVQEMLAEQKIKHEPLLPIILGRLTHINGVVPDAAWRKKSLSLEYELRLTWSENLLEGDSISQGAWWNKNPTRTSQFPEVSVGAEQAKNIGLKIGDRLRFSIAGLEHEAEVSSIRKYETTATKTSFGFVFEPKSMRAFTATYMSTFYLPPEQKTFSIKLLRAHPSMTVYELDRAIEQMKAIIKQVTDAVVLILWLSLAAGCLVMLSAVLSSLDRRQQENGLLRAFGTSRRLLLGSVLIEFSVLGFLSGTVAIIGSELILFALQEWVLETAIHPHYLYWLLSPCLSALLLGCLGILCCRKIITTPPSVVLRGATAS